MSAEPLPAALVERPPWAVCGATLITADHSVSDPRQTSVELRHGPLPRLELSVVVGARGDGALLDPVLGARVGLVRVDVTNTTLSVHGRFVAALDGEPSGRVALAAGRRFGPVLLVVEAGVGERGPDGVLDALVQLGPLAPRLSVGVDAQGEPSASGGVTMQWSRGFETHLSWAADRVVVGAGVAF